MLSIRTMFIRIQIDTYSEFTQVNKTSTSYHSLGVDKTHCFTHI